MADNEATWERKRAKVAEIRENIEVELGQIPINARDTMGQLTVNRALVALLADALVRIEILEESERSRS
jgi:hypothetical protein